MMLEGRTKTPAVFASGKVETPSERTHAANCTSCLLCWEVIEPAPPPPTPPVAR